MEIERFWRSEAQAGRWLRLRSPRCSFDPSCAAISRRRQLTFSFSVLLWKTFSAADNRV
jgi:hypothetical protein